MDTIEQLKKNVDDAAALRDKVGKEYSKVQEKWVGVLKNHEKAIERYSVAMHESVKNAGQEALIEFFLTHPYDLPYDTLYKIRDQFFHSIGLYRSGTNSETGQSVIQVSFSPNKPAKNAKVLESLRKCLPYIKPCAGGYKYVDLIENSLSEHGSYNLHIYSENDVKLSFTRYGRESITDLGTLDQAAEYIARRHPYD